MDSLNRPHGFPNRRDFLKLAAISASSTAMTRLTSLHAATPPIRMGVVGLSFYRVVGGVIQNVLESSGYTVEISEGSLIVRAESDRNHAVVAEVCIVGMRFNLARLQV